MNEEFYSEYWRDIATRLFGGPDHFWELEDDEKLSDLNAALKNDLTLPALILRPFESGFSIDMDNNTDTWTGTFTILHPATSADMASIKAARSIARQQAKEVLAVLRRDARPVDPRDGKGGKLKAQRIHLMPTFTGSDEPVIFGQATGWSYDFEWRVPAQLPAPAW